MTCRELSEFLDDYLEGGLALDVRATFEHHLRLCPNCACYLASYRQTIVACHDVCTCEDDNALPDELVQAILATVKPKPSA